MLSGKGKYLIYLFVISKGREKNPTSPIGAEPQEFWFTLGTECDIQFFDNFISTNKV